MLVSRPMTYIGNRTRTHLQLGRDRHCGEDAALFPLRNPRRWGNVIKAWVAALFQAGVGEALEPLFV